MLRTLLVGTVLFFQMVASAQSTPAFRQFYFNPYLFNPAFAGAKGYTQVSLVYRKQWAGFTDAPVASGFSVEYPTNNKVSAGFSFLSQDVAALQTTSLQGTFVYRVPLTANQFLFFGISGLAGFNKLNTSDADYSNDPAILAAADDGFYANANFGAVYELAGLRVGFALPELFRQPHYSMPETSLSYSQLRNQLYSVNYKLRAGNFSIEPYVLYRLNEDFQDWWEGATILYFKEKLWLGGSYHSTQGQGFFFGMDVKEKFKFGYSYELPPPDDDFISTSSHEFQIQIRIGKKRVYKWAAKYSRAEETVAEVAEISVPKSEPSPDTLIIQTLPVVIVEDSVEENETEPQEVIIQQDTLIQEEPVVVEKLKPSVQAVLAPGYYIIAGSFQSLESAREHQVRLSKNGYKDVQTGFNSKNKRYYIYVFSSYDVAECKQALIPLKEKKDTREAWILKIEE